MTQEYEDNSIKHLNSDRCDSNQREGSLPSVFQQSEIIITNKNLKEAGYRNFNVIIKLLYTYTRENNVLPLDSKKDSCGVIVLKNGKSFPIYYKLRNRHWCFSILKDDVEHFNTFLYENMPNNRMILPQSPLCLDKEVPVLREYMRHFLNPSRKKAERVCKIIYDACVSGERISHDKILVTITTKSQKPDLKLMAYCRSFNGMICYALEKGSIPKINEYFGFSPVTLSVCKRGEITLGGLDSLYRRQIPSKYEKYKTIKKVFLRQLEIERKKNPLKTTFNISLQYNRCVENFTVCVRRAANDELIYTLDRNCVDKFNNLITGFPKLNLKNEIQITYERLRDFNDEQIEINDYIVRLLKNLIKERLKNNEQVTIELKEGKRITFFYRHNNSFKKLIAISKNDKDNLLDFIKQEICKKRKLTIGRKIKISQDEIPINASTFVKMFNMTTREARAKSREIAKIYEKFSQPTKVDVKCRLLLPDNTTQSIVIGKRSNGIGTGKRFVFKEKDIPLLKYYFGVITKEQYKELIKNREEHFSERENTLAKQNEELAREYEGIAKQYHDTKNTKEQREDLAKQYEKMAKPFNREAFKYERNSILNIYDQPFEASHDFIRTHKSLNCNISVATNIFKEKEVPTYGGLSTVVPLPLDNLYITGSELGLITFWRRDKNKPLYIPELKYRLSCASVRDIVILKNKLIVMHNEGIKILKKDKDSVNCFKVQELNFDIIPECMTGYLNRFGQSVIYLYFPSKSLVVYKSEAGEQFRFVGQISNLPIEAKGHVKKIIPLNNKRFLMFFNTGEIYNLPLKEDILKEDVILVEKLDKKIKCVSNLFNDLLFIITKDKRGHWYRFNESYSTMDEEYSLRLKFLKGKNRVKNALLRDNVCYIYSTDKYGFNSDLLKITINY